jgi:hypothetical protein
MNKEQKIQELSDKIDELKQELEELKELQEKQYKIRYPKAGTKIYYINHNSGVIQCRLNIIGEGDRHLYDIGLLFDTYEQAEQFKREQTLIKKIKCWAKEQQGDWQPNWSDTNQCKYCVDVDRFNKETSYDWYWEHDKLFKLPYFKSQEIAKACIDEFGDEILEVFC